MIALTPLHSPQAPISSTLAVANGMSWHAKLPIVAVAGNKCIHFWGVEAWTSHPFRWTRVCCVCVCYCNLLLSPEYSFLCLHSLTLSPALHLGTHHYFLLCLSPVGLYTSLTPVTESSIIIKVCLVFLVVNHQHDNMMFHVSSHDNWTLLFHT